MEAKKQWKDASAHREPPYPQPVKVDARKSVYEILEVVRRGRWLMLISLAVCVAGAVVFTYLQRPVYRASSLLMVRSQQTSGTGKSDALNYGIVQNQNLSTRDIYNQVLLIQQSVAIARAASERLLELHASSPDGQRLTVLEGIEAPTVDVIAPFVQARIRAEPDGDKTDAIWITGFSEDPYEAALLANLYAEEYVKRTTERSRLRITGSREFLEGQIAKYQDDLRRIEDQIKAMNSAGAMALDAEVQRSITQIAQIEAALDEVRVEQRTREAALESAERELAQLHPRLVQRVASGVEGEIERTQKRIADLELVAEQIYLENPSLRNNPSRNETLQKLEEQIRQLRNRTRTLSEQYIGEVLALGGIDPKESSMDHVIRLNQRMVEERIALSGLEAKRGALEQRLNAYSAKLDQIPGQAMQLAQLERARKSTEQIYLDLVDKLQEARIAEESEVGLAEIIRPAVVPFSSRWSNAYRNLLVGILFGLALGLGVAVARNKLDARIHSPEDLRAQGMGVIGVIPDMRPSIKTLFRGKPKVTLQDGRSIDTTLFSLLSPATPVAEAFRHLYVNLQFSVPDSVVQTILLTSPEAGAGKSTVALNLAITTAQAGRRTVVVEADLRRPVLGKILGINPQYGILDLVQGEPEDLSLQHFATDIDDLYVITARKPMASPLDVLGSKQMRDLIQRLQTVFDVVILDTPPVLAASDASLLSTLCDVTIVVASAENTSSDALKYTSNELRGVGARLLGVVLNRFDPRSDYRSRHIYGYRNQYYSAADVTES